MELLAVSLLLCTVLYLVDKNAAWGKFWRVTKYLAALAVLASLALGGYLYWDERRMAQKQPDWFEQNAPKSTSH